MFVVSYVRVAIDKIDYRPYLSAGVISVRQCVRATLLLSNNKLNVDKGSSIGVCLLLSALSV